MAFFIALLLFLLPSQSYTAQYRIFSLHTLCSPDKSNTWIESVFHDKDATTIDLHDQPLQSSVLIEHVWDNSSYKHFHHCEFNIRAHSKWLQEAKSGLFAAIRQLNFRQNTAGECIDYVIFEVNTLTAPTSHKICGTVYENDEYLDEKNYFEIPDGSVKVVVHIGPHTTQPNKIIMKLSFTAFEDCTGSYKFHCTNSKCISDNLYNDLVINCIPPFCTDEPRFYSKCGTSPAIIPPKRHVLVILSAFVVMIFFVAMSWNFLRIYEFCYRYFGIGMTTENDVPGLTVEYQTVYVPPAADPAADPVADPVADPAADNTHGEARSSTDNPPTYDSLFK